MKIPESLRNSALKRYRQRVVSRLVAAVEWPWKGGDASITPDGFPARRILIVRSARSLGNLLTLTPLLAELERVFPGAEVDIATALPVASDVFRNFPQLGRVHVLPRRVLMRPFRYLAGLSALRKRRYDLVINPISGSNSGRLLPRLLRPGIVFTGSRYEGASGERRHAARTPVIALRRQLLKLPEDCAVPVSPLDIRLDESERRSGKAILDRILPSDGIEPVRRISLFTGGTGRKRLDPAWWEAFHGLLSERLGAFEFVEILPADGRSGLSGRIPTFYSTHIRRVAAVIAATDAFIGTDSGIMHLASAAGVPTIGLFALADPEVWAPFGPAKGLALKAGPDGRQCAERACQAVMHLVG